MGLFNRGKKDNTEEPQDFVLFGSEEETLDNSDTIDVSDTVEDTSGVEEELDNTAVIDTAEVISAVQNSEDPLPSAPDRPKKKGNGFFINYIAKHKGISIAVCAVLVATVVMGGAFGVLRFSNPLHGYAMVAADKGNIMKTMDVEGTLATVDKYEITSLVAGKIIESDFEVGDNVRANEVIFKLDDTEAKLAVERAKNEVERANDTTTASDKDVARILATENGIVQKINITTGGRVAIGMKIGTIETSDGTVLPITSYVSGTVVVVSVSAGRSVSAGQVIATIRTDESAEDIKNRTYDKKSAEIDLQTAQRQLDNYTIKSPVSGIVIEKNKRAGDNVGITDAERPMMVILDTSKLAFTFKVDEYKFGEIERGQSVGINVDSISDTTFSGEVTSVSTEGTAGEDGNPLYEVTVTITEPGDLKAGMNVKAKVVLASVNNALNVPQNALMESDGQNALVFVKSMEDDVVIEDEYDESTENQLNYPWIKVPKGCRLISVKYGISDGTNVQILSGLKPGDIVVFDNKATGEGFVESTSDGFGGGSIGFPSTGGNSFGIPADEDDDEDVRFFVEDDTEDSETQDELRDEIKRLLGGDNETI